MATVVNSRDLKLQTVTPRFNTVRARGLYLNTDSSNFVVKADNTVLPSSGIIFTAEYSNITSAVSTTPVFTVTPTGAATLTAIDSMHKKLLFSDMLQDKVTVTATITDTAGVTYTSSSEVSKLREPDIGVDISLDTNVFKVVAGTATPGNIKVTIATKFLEFIGSPTFTLTAVDASDVTISGITLVPDVVLPNVWLLDYDDLVSAGVSSLWVKVSVTDKYSVTHTNKAAVTTISDAQYVTVTGEQAFKFLAGSSTPTSSTITLTAFLTGGLTTYDWEYWNGSAWVNLSGTQNTSTYSLAYNNAAWSSTTLRVRCLSGSVYDEITVVKLYDGSSGTSPVIGYLTNETIALASASDGTGYNVSNAYGTFKMFSGTTDVTSSTSYSIPGGTAGAGIYSITQNGLTLTIGIGNGYYYVSGSSWTTDVESFTVRGIYNSVIVDKVFTVSKARAGTAGSNGTNGTNGTNGINGTDGTDGRTYALAITGGTRSFVYNAAGTASSPTTSAAYGMSLTLDGSVVTPSSYTWSATGRLYGTSSTSAFTPTVNQTYSGDNTSVTLSVTHGSPAVTTSLTVPIGIGKVGDTGVSGKKTVIARLFKWSISETVIPNSVDSTYDWSTNTLTVGATLSSAGWSTSSTGTGTTGQRLYSLEKTLTVNSDYFGTSDVVYWSTTTGGPIATFNTIGYRLDGSIGPQGIGSRIAYVVTTSSTAPTLITQPVSGDTLPDGTARPGSNALNTWCSTPKTSLASGEYMYQSDGEYNSTTNQTTWLAPYLSNLKVGRLSAITADLGIVTLASGNGSIATVGRAYGATSAGVFLGFDGATSKLDITKDASTYLRYDGSLLEVKGGSITGGSIVGSTLNIGGSDATSFNADIDGNIWSGATSLASAPFKVTNAGVLTATGVNVTGTISSSSATITGGTLSVGTGNTIFKVDASGNHWAGNATQGSAPFQVTNTGALTATSATVTGTVQTASSGKRIVIDSSTNSLKFYTSTDTIGNPTVEIGASTGDYVIKANATQLMPGIYANCNSSGTVDQPAITANGDSNIEAITSAGTVRITNATNSTTNGALHVHYPSGGATQRLALFEDLSTTVSAVDSVLVKTSNAYRTALNVQNTAASAAYALKVTNLSSFTSAYADPTAKFINSSTGPAIEVQGGVKFPATFANNTDTNTLDDYKEATWTPTVVGSGTGIAVGSASYTKVGRAINFTLNLTFTAAGTGVVTFTLPQATSTNFSFSCFAAGTATGMAGPVLAWADSGTSTVNINYFNLSTGVMGSSDMATKVKSGTDIRISGTYW